MRKACIGVSHRFTTLYVVALTCGGDWTLSGKSRGLASVKQEPKFTDPAPKVSFDMAPFVNSSCRDRTAEFTAITDRLNKQQVRVVF